MLSYYDTQDLTGKKSGHASVLVNQLDVFPNGRLKYQDNVQYEKESVDDKMVTLEVSSQKR